METTEKTIWINLPEDEKLTILSNIAEEKGIKENAVEKDFWVSMVLKAMFSLEYSDNLVFKGGTSLSKGWGLIERFSEDCDPEARLGRHGHQERGHPLCHGRGGGRSQVRG